MWRVALLSLLIVNQLSLPGQTGLKALLPTEDEAPGWRVAGETREYSGDNLFSLINGGANLYLEYGFVEVIAASVVNEQGEELKLEIYRMGDSFGANAVYLQKRSGASDSYSVGNDAFINGGSLGFWKHHYFALIRSDKESESVIEGMKMVADIVASRIRPKGQIPDLSKKFNNRPGRVTLLRGKIALSNIYYFTTTDVFRIEEGVAIEEPGRIEIWLLYDNSHITIQRLGEVAGILSRETRFTSFMMSGDQSFRLEDKKGNIIDIEATGKYLKIIVADSRSVSQW
jgi:uncharacterized protein YuzE